MVSKRLSGFDQRFGIAEHLVQGCSDSCGQVNQNPAQEVKCSKCVKQYCATPKMIASEECSPYVGRAIRDFEQESILYKDKKNTSSTFVQYYNALGDASKAYLEENINNLSDRSVANFMKLVKQEQNGKPSALFNELADIAAERCTKSCNAQWLVDFMKRKIYNTTQLMKDEPAYKFIDLMTQEIGTYKKFYKEFEPMRVMLANKLTVADLINPKLLKLIDRPNQITIAVNNIALSYITETRFTGAEPTVNDILNKPKLYDSTILHFLKHLKQIYPEHSLLTLYEEATNENIDHWIKSGMKDTPTYLAMMNSGDFRVVDKIYEALVQQCTQKTFAKSENCVSYYNKLTPNQKNDKLFMSAFQAAINPDGSLDKAYLDRLDGIKDWIKMKMIDAKTKDEKSLHISCGPNKGLSLEHCKMVCQLYPEICESESFEDNEQWVVWNIIVRLLLFVFFIVLCVKLLRIKSIDDLFCFRKASHSQSL